MQETPVKIDGPVGVLEGLYMDPGDAQGLMLLCHPNPEHGGTLLNKVVSTLQRAARDAGYCTLRFNYRGTGGSAGEHDMGEGEVDDAEAAWQWLQAKHPELPMNLGGFSFGGFVSLSLAARMDQQGKAPQRIILLAPALWRLSADIVVPKSSRLLIVQPANDEIVDPQAVHDWSRAHQYHPHELLKVAECGHFFHGKLIELRDLLKPYL